MKIFSLIVLATFVLLYSLWGVYDYRCTTTSDLLQHPKLYENSKVNLSCVSLLSYHLYTTSDDPDKVVVELVLWNGYHTPKPTSGKESIQVFGLMSSKSPLLAELKNGLKGFSGVVIEVTPQINRLVEYQDIPDVSWLTSPFLITRNLLNRWISLQAATLAALGIQILILGVIVKLVYEGWVHVLPEA